MKKTAALCFVVRHRTTNNIVVNPHSLNCGCPPPTAVYAPTLEQRFKGLNGRSGEQ